MIPHDPERPPLKGKEKSRLRGIGQTLEASLKVGKDGATPTVVAELQRLLERNELIKVRYVEGDRRQRAALSEQLATATSSQCVGSVGATALFYRPRETTKA
jgi:RNA-binding protein